MKTLFIVKEVVSDDDGNLYCEVEIFFTEEEAIEYIITRHEDVYDNMIHYNSYDEECEVNDDWDEDNPSDGFDICLEDDYGIRTIVTLETKNILIK